MEGFLNNYFKFNNSLSDLLFQLFSVKIVSLKSFLHRSISKTYCFQRSNSGNILLLLFHLNRSWWLRRQIIEHPIHSLYLIHDSVHHSLEYAKGNIRAFCGHKVIGNHRAESHRVVIGTKVSHNPHGAHIGEGGKILAVGTG